MDTITADMKLRWIIEDGKPFNGTTHSILLPDNTVAYTDGMTLEQYELERGFKPKVISDAELNRLMRIHEEDQITKPKRITKARYWDMLEILPPCRWHMAGTWEVFHVSERLSGHLVSWFGTRRLAGNEVFFEFIDYDHLATDKLRDKLNLTGG